MTDHVKDLQPWQLRVVEEATALLDKIGRLDVFIEGAKYKALPVVDRVLLTQQREFMHGYWEILNERVRRFGT